MKTVERNAAKAKAVALGALRENVVYFRAAASLSQTEFAAKAGVARPVVSKLEQGLEQPSFESLAKIAAVIGCSIADLLLHRHQATEASDEELSRRALSSTKNDVDVIRLLDVIEEANGPHRYSRRGRKPTVARNRRS